MPSTSRTNSNLLRGNENIFQDGHTHCMSVLESAVTPPAIINDKIHKFWNVWRHTTELCYCRHLQREKIQVADIKSTHIHKLPLLSVWIILSIITKYRENTHMPMNVFFYFILICLVSVLRGFGCRCSLHA